VLTGLQPYVVAMHFVLAVALLTTTTLTWHRASAISASITQPPVSRRTAKESSASDSEVAATFVLIVIRYTLG
jgi:cytochrome c oxidase assembly protein subunit 15